MRGWGFRLDKLSSLGTAAGDGIEIGGSGGSRLCGGGRWWDARGRRWAIYPWLIKVNPVGSPFILSIGHLSDLPLGYWRLTVWPFVPNRPGP